jgi:hypothetical protein
LLVAAGEALWEIIVSFLAYNESNGWGEGEALCMIKRRNGIVASFFMICP